MTSDIDLILAYKNDRDRAAINELFGRYYPAVYRVLLHLVNNSADANDLTQQVFLKAIKGADDYKPVAPFRNWLASIAVNEAKNYYRTKSREIRPDPLFDEYRTAREDTPVEDVQRREFEQHLDLALEKLPEKLRVPLVLHYFEEMSFADIAEILSVPKSTVQTRLETALERLRAIFKETGHAALIPLIAMFIPGAGKTAVGTGIASSLVKVFSIGGAVKTKAALLVVTVAIAIGTVSIVATIRPEAPREREVPAAAATAQDSSGGTHGAQAENKPSGEPESTGADVTAGGTREEDAPATSDISSEDAELVESGLPVLIGTVYADGRPSVGARVYTLDKVAERIVAFRRTDMNGRYRFDFDEPGEYIVKAACYGYTAGKGRRSGEYQRKKASAPGICDFRFGLTKETAGIIGFVEAIHIDKTTGRSDVVKASHFKVYVFREEYVNTVGDTALSAEAAELIDIRARLNRFSRRELVLAEEFRDPRGEFEIDGLTDGYYLLAAETLDEDPNPGQVLFAQRLEHAGDSHGKFRLRTRPLETYHGFVKSADDGVPVEGARIAFYYYPGDNSNVPEKLRRLLEVSVTSGKNGEFSVTGPKNYSKCRTVHPDFLELDPGNKGIIHRSAGDLNSPIAICLTRNIKPGGVRGDLSSYAVLGFENLRVLLETTFYHEGYEAVVNDWKVFASAVAVDGSFSFGNLPAGVEYGLWIVDNDGRVIDRRMNCFVPDEGGFVNLDYRAGTGSIFGTVTIDGKPAEGVEVGTSVTYSIRRPETRPDGEVVLCRSRISNTTWTDRGGRYELRGIPPNGDVCETFSLHADFRTQSIDGSRLMSREEYTIKEGERLKIDFDLERPNCVRFVFKDAYTGEDLATDDIRGVTINPITSPGGQVDYSKKNTKHAVKTNGVVRAYRLPRGWYRIRGGVGEPYSREDVDFLVTGESIQVVEVPLICMKKHLLLVKLFEKETGEPLQYGLPGIFRLFPPGKTDLSDSISPHHVELPLGPDRLAAIGRKRRKLEPNEVIFWVPGPGEYRLLLRVETGIFEQDSSGRRTEKLIWPPKEETEFNLTVDGSLFQEFEVVSRAVVDFKVTALDAAGYAYRPSGDEEICVELLSPDGRLLWFWNCYAGKTPELTRETEDIQLKAPGAGTYLIRVSSAHPGSKAVVLVEEEVVVDHDHTRPLKEQSFTLQAPK